MWYRLTLEMPSLLPFINEKVSDLKAGTIVESVCWQQPVRSLNVSWTTISNGCLKKFFLRHSPVSGYHKALLIWSSLFDNYKKICCEQVQRPYIDFIDLSKAFDRVSRELFWDVLARYGFPDKFIRILQLLHDDIIWIILISSTNAASEQKLGY